MENDKIDIKQKYLPFEKWKEIEYMFTANEELNDFYKDHKIRKYEYVVNVSNYGRLMVRKKDREYTGLYQCEKMKGYPVFYLYKGYGRSECFYLHKVVAQLFLKRPKEVVIHKEWDKINNIAENLKWATKAESLKHQQNNPLTKHLYYKGNNTKLTEGQVKQIKILLKRGNTPKCRIAKQFSVSETQIKRIKSGENWSYVTIKEE